MRVLAQTASDGQSGRATPVAEGGISTLWSRLRRGPADRRALRVAAHTLYGRVVAQSRQPFFFRDLAVPDTREGRLEMLQLHAMLAMRRLSPLGAPGMRLSQALYDLMFEDLDRHLREWGIGDLSVGKHVKKSAQSFMARVAAIDPALEAGDSVAMHDPLLHNVYEGSTIVDPAAVTAMARYLLAQHRRLASVSDALMLCGEPSFAVPEDLLAGSASAETLDEASGPAIDPPPHSP